ncbi:MAG: hypothetical protein F6J90_31245 [Moorea sp. SIOASIH]|uniref:WD40 repeat domain-containing protein n=1 Tax=Moorena sp. SIOASIH TaxID=2607817 RepID=UPI0013B7B5AE|nr:hypothetical protein [Moorena sp. SIOASIH]NEO40567.1 hypothetical protein [Moorena sp. SIOASIH]
MFAQSPTPALALHRLVAPHEQNSYSKVIVSGSRNGIVRLWDTQGNPIGQIFKGHKADVTSISFSPDGQTIATASLDGAFILWNLQGQEKLTLQSFGATISSVSFSPDGQTIATGSLDGTV